MWWRTKKRLFYWKDGDGDGGDGGGGGGGGDGDGGGGDGNGGGGGGGGGETWRSGLPEDLQTVKTLEKFDDVPALAQSYVNLEQMLGRDKIPMPQSDEEWRETFTKLGMPAESKDYGIVLPDGEIAPHLKQIMQADRDWFQEQAHKAGLTKKQANEVFAGFSERLLGQNTVLDERALGEKAKTEESLKGEYGDAYKVKMTLANRAITEIGGKELADGLAKLGMGRSLPVVKAFIKIGEEMAEAGGIDKNTGDPVEAPEELKDQISSLMGSKAYLNASDPKHAYTVQKVAKLNQKLYPE